VKYGATFYSRHTALDEAYLSKIKRQKTMFKSRQHILRVIQHYSRRNIGTSQQENAEKLN
jgi:hypothetical protein